MSEMNKTLEERGSNALRQAEEQISDLIKTLEEQDSQVWAYLIGGVVALIVGLIAAYLITQTARERRKSRLERIRESLRGGIARLLLRCTPISPPRVILPGSGASTCSAGWWGWRSACSPPISTPVSLKRASLGSPTASRRWTR